MRRGIDVSAYQGEINWKRVREAGIDWAMVKASQATYVADRFHENITNAASAGVQCGVYHFLTAQNQEEADKEVNFFLSTIAKYRTLIDLYVCLDVESAKLPADKTVLTEMVRRAYKRIEDAGYKAIVYTNLNWLRTRLADISDLRIWLAWWKPKTALPARDYHPSLARMMLWQWGVEQVDGIEGSVDSNFMLEEELKNDYSNHPDAAYIRWAMNKGLLATDGDSFKPDEPVTRAEMVKLLYKLGDGLR